MRYLYHGTVRRDLTILTPQTRYTPGDAALADSIPPRIYATYNPAYAVAHSFPWSSDDGVDVEEIDDVIHVIVPREKQSVLEQVVCIYTLPDDTFVHTPEEVTGLTYHSDVAVTPISHECFDTVTEALEKYGGALRLI